MGFPERIPSELIFPKANIAPRRSVTIRVETAVGSLYPIATRRNKNRIARPVLIPIALGG